MNKEIHIAVNLDVDDIWDAAEEEDITLTEDQCEDILLRISKNYDARIYFNWEVIPEAIHEYIS